MSLCALCAHPTLGGDVLCGYHAAADGGDWATGNRIICDFLHRGIVLASGFHDATAAAPRRWSDTRPAATILDGNESPRP
jgi:hypothetical protein